MTFLENLEGSNWDIKHFPQILRSTGSDSHSPGGITYACIYTHTFLLHKTLPVPPGELCLNRITVNSVRAPLHLGSADRPFLNG